MGAGLFLNIVTIGAGLLMLFVAGSILYHKYPDILGEFRELLGSYSQRRQTSDGESQEVEARVVNKKDFKAAVDKSVSKKYQRRVQKGRPTMKSCSPSSPQFSVSPDAREQEVEDDWKKEALRIAEKRKQSENQIYSSFLYQPQQSYQRSHVEEQQDMDVDSFADSCSCYLDASYVDQPTSVAPTHKPSVSFATKSNNINISSNHEGNIALDDISCMDYSVDSSTIMITDNRKESFSSFAKPHHHHQNFSLADMDITTAGHTEEDPTELEDTISRLPYSHHSLKHSLFLTGNHLDEVESVETSVVPPSEATSNEESDQYSTVRPSVLTFNSRNTSEATSTYTDRIVQVSNTVNDSVSPLKTVTNTQENIISKRPKRLLASLQSALRINVDIDHDNNSHDTDEELGIWKKQTTKKEDNATPHTVSTDGIWSPSSEADPNRSPKMNDIIPEEERDIESENNDSFTSEKSSSLDDPETLEIIQREARNECFAPFSHSVHVCKSASCTACRSHEEPIFLNATKTSTGQKYNLSRTLPKRWWNTGQAEEVSKLKQYVSSALLTRPQQRAHEVLEHSMEEEHPFDEA